jgi:hypothetical protein
MIQFYKNLWMIPHSHDLSGNDGEGSTGRSQDGIEHLGKFEVKSHGLEPQQRLQTVSADGYSASNFAGSAI